MNIRCFLTLAGFGLALGCGGLVRGQGEALPWRPLFNGKDLDGWKPKITGHALGEDPYKTFRAEDGVIKVSYDQYKEFGGKFGHLFYKEPFGDYRLRLEYRFVGKQANGGPGWALRNSGVMIHCQDPETMRVAQDFPVSIEVQFLGGDGTNPRQTGNLCTPGTHVVMKDSLLTRHCTTSVSNTHHGDGWVKAEVVVRGAGVIEHWIEGRKVLEYEKAQYDDKDKDGKILLMKAGGKRLIERGYISLQAESHPVEFRSIEVQELKNQAKTR